jgi:hypothetical protein
MNVVAKAKNEDSQAVGEKEKGLMKSRKRGYIQTQI